MSQEGHQTLLGRSTHTYFTPAIAAIYRDLFYRLRSKQQSIRIPFHCDGPRVRRGMLLDITPRADGGLELQAWLSWEEPRRRVPLLDASMTRSKTAFVTMCAWCKRVSREGTWLPFEDALKASWLDQDPLPRISHGIYQRCEQALIP